MTDISDIRIANGRLLLERVGGATALAKRMGYANPAYVVQIFGPNPSRRPTEKFMRKLEVAMGLPTGSTDVDHGKTKTKADKNLTLAASKIDPKKLTDLMLLVDKLVMEANAKVSRERYAALVALAYEDLSETGSVQEQVLRRFIQLPV